MDEFKDTEYALQHHLRRAERHAQSAYTLLFREDGPKRSLWYRMLVGRAQSILMSLYVQEVNRKGRKDAA